MKPRTLPTSGATVFLLAALGCGADLLFGVRQLEFAPNPAQPGDSVSCVFWLTVVPAQDYTITVFVDSSAYVTEDGFEGVDGPMVLGLGAADDLITRYGLGTHTAFVEVRLRESARTARTASRTLELQAAAQPAGGRPVTP